MPPNLPSPTGYEPPAVSGLSGTAAYCEPTPKYCRTWGGDAHLAAVPTFRWGDEPYPLTVCRQDKPNVCAHVTVVSYCACGTHVVDLSLAAFLELAPKPAGVVHVTLSEAVLPTPPSTDSEGSQP